MVHVIAHESLTKLHFEHTRILVEMTSSIEHRKPNRKPEGDRKKEQRKREWGVGQEGEITTVPSAATRKIKYKNGRIPDQI